MVEAHSKVKKVREQHLGYSLDGVHHALALDVLPGLPGQPVPVGDGDNIRPGLFFFSAFLTRPFMFWMWIMFATGEEISSVQGIFCR